MQKLKHIIDFILYLILPRTCFSCGRDLPRKDTGLLCQNCKENIKLIDGLICQRCGVPLKSGGAFCYNCRGSKGAKYKCAMIRSSLEFTPASRALVHAFKYERYVHIAPYFANLMYKTYLKNPAFKEAEMLVPVPIYKSRQRVRGFNQAEILANHLSKHCNIPVVNALKRVIKTESQTKLHKAERAENVQNAFCMQEGISVKRKAIILIDDVCTTSATLEECARILKKNGAREVLALTALRE